MKSLVSVIVPVYKTENHLVRCLDSLRSQSLADIEILLIDDATPDRCREICDEYANKDARFKVIHNQTNQGLSVARNIGIANATCDYLMFVDSDDWVHEDFCKLPYECAIRFQADMVLFERQRIYKPALIVPFQKEYHSLGMEKSGYRTRWEVIELLETNIGHVAWNKLYHRKLFDGISYPVGYFYEDLGTTYKTVLRGECFYYLNLVLYYNNNFRKGRITQIRNDKAVNDKFTMFMRYYRDLVSNGYPAEKLDYKLKFNSLSSCIAKQRDFSNNDYIFCSNILKNCEKIPEKFTQRQKIMLMLYNYSPFLFELVCKLYGLKVK